MRVIPKKIKKLFHIKLNVEHIRIESVQSELLQLKARNIHLLKESLSLSLHILSKIHIIVTTNMT